jgi:hypothetical protein
MNSLRFLSLANYGPNNCIVYLKIVDHTIYEETETNSIGDDNVGGMQCPPTIQLEAYVVGHNISIERNGCAFERLPTK